MGLALLHEHVVVPLLLIYTCMHASIEETIISSHESLTDCLYHEPLAEERNFVIFIVFFFSSL